MELTEIVTKLALPLGLAFIMFSMGLTLKLRDFRPVFARPTALVTGLFVQMVCLPLTAFLLLQSWPVAPAFAVGIMILAASPGGITSNILTHMAKGDTALSISLTALSSLAGIFAVPLIVGLSLQWFIEPSRAPDLSVAKMILGVFMVSTAPLLTGLLINQLRPHLATKMERRSGPLAIGIFLLIVISAFASSWQIMMDNIATIGPIMLLLNVLIMLTGWLLARSARLDKPQIVAISLEGGLQNGALGIFVALTLLNDTTMMIPSITYALFMNLSAAIFIFWRLNRQRRRASVKNGNN